MSALERMGVAAASTGTVIALFCPAILGWQMYFWLRWGYWFPLSVRTAWYWAMETFEPQTEWLGLNQIIHWVFDVPLSVTTLFVGMLLAKIGVNLEHAGKPQPSSAKVT